MNPKEYSKNQPIIEMYGCLQSEGKLTGVPHILIRTTGCTLRCQFSKTDFCDSSYTSWSPEKGTFSLNNVINFFKKHPQIKHTMITGGSPTMHENLLRELCIIAKSFGHYITIETEGSKYVSTVADFISLSPKFSNSTPKLGTLQPNGKEVTLSHVKRHEKYRKNHEAMGKMIKAHGEYQLKPVVSSVDDLEEIKYIQEKLNIPNNKVYLMPAGGTVSELEKHRSWLMEYCWQNGYNYTDRIHIIAYGEKRGF